MYVNVKKIIDILDAPSWLVVDGEKVKNTDDIRYCEAVRYLNDITNHEEYKIGNDYHYLELTANHSTNLNMLLLYLENIQEPNFVNMMEKGKKRYSGVHPINIILNNIKFEMSCPKNVTGINRIIERGKWNKAQNEAIARNHKNNK